MVTHTVHRKDEHKRGDSNVGICKWKEWRISVYLGRVRTLLNAGTCPIPMRTEMGPKFGPCPIPMRT